MSRPRKRSHPNLGKLYVIHYERSHARTLMFDVTRAAFLNACMKLGRLTTEQTRGVRVTRRAIGNRHPDHRLVARRAPIT
jgi:hypothetical protein